MEHKARRPGLFSNGQAHPARYLYVGLKEKTGVLAHWLAGRRNEVSFSEMVRFLLRKPLMARGRDLVTELETEAGYHRVRFRGLPDPIYYPAEFDLPSLYINVCSVASPDDWHYYEAPETRVAAGDTVLDCGAAEGLFTLSVAGRCREVYAIEPLPRFISALEKTLNKVGNAVVMPFALSDAAGEELLTDAGPWSSIDIQREGTAIPVRASTVDGLFFERGIPVDFIKADLEGHELLMLKGAENTLRKNTPKVSVTTYHRKEHADSICRYLKSIDARYRFRTRGINQFGTPFMLHAWVE